MTPIIYSTVLMFILQKLLYHYGMTRRMWLRCSYDGGVWTVWLKIYWGDTAHHRSGVTVKGRRRRRLYSVLYIHVTTCIDFITCIYKQSRGDTNKYEGDTSMMRRHVIEQLHWIVEQYNISTLTLKFLRFFQALKPNVGSRGPFLFVN